MAGGTLITIGGDGFVSSLTSINLDLSLYYNNFYANVTYNSIVLTTSENQEGTFSFNVFVNQIKAMCSIDCNFTFTSDKTPEITSISPDTFTDLNTTFTISGNKFSNDKTKVHVKIGTQYCEIDSVNDTSIICVLPRLNLENQSITILVDGKLFTFKQNNKTLNYIYFEEFSYLRFWKFFKFKWFGKWIEFY